MTDRELLELAAKAAGMLQAWNANWSGMYNELSNGNWDSSSRWNPLTDDGDALRLAVKLRLHVDHNRVADNRVTVWVLKGDKADPYRECGDDPYAATRRAIVRAAAEIGGEL